MPGVADQIRRTQLKQEQKARKADMEKILRLVREGRLHEADERELETVRLALELNKLIEERRGASFPDSSELTEAIKKAISEGMADVQVRTVPSADPDRPKMRHVSLADIVQDKSRIDITHQETIDQEVEGESSKEKLAKLKKLKSSDNGRPEKAS